MRAVPTPAAVAPPAQTQVLWALAPFHTRAGCRGIGLRRPGPLPLRTSPSPTGLGTPPHLGHKPHPHRP